MFADVSHARVECPVSFFVQELVNPVALASVEFGVLYTCLLYTSDAADE